MDHGPGQRCAPDLPVIPRQVLPHAGSLQAVPAHITNCKSRHPGNLLLVAPPCWFLALLVEPKKMRRPWLLRRASRFPRVVLRRTAADPDETVAGIGVLRVSVRPLGHPARTLQRRDSCRRCACPTGRSPGTSSRVSRIGCPWFAAGFSLEVRRRVWGDCLRAATRDAVGSFHLRPSRRLASSVRRSDATCSLWDWDPAARPATDAAVLRRSSAGPRNG